jgi:hypothetical protein
MMFSTQQEAAIGEVCEVVCNGTEGLKYVKR